MRNTRDSYQDNDSFIWRYPPSTSIVSAQQYRVGLPVCCMRLCRRTPCIGIVTWAPICSIPQSRSQWPLLSSSFFYRHCFPLKCQEGSSLLAPRLGVRIYPGLFSFRACRVFFFLSGCELTLFCCVFLSAFFIRIAFFSFFSPCLFSIADNHNNNNKKTGGEHREGVGRSTAVPQRGGRKHLDTVPHGGIIYPGKTRSSVDLVANYSRYGNGVTKS